MQKINIVKFDESSHDTRPRGNCIPQHPPSTPNGSHYSNQRTKQLGTVLCFGSITLTHALANPTILYTVTTEVKGCLG